MELVDGDGDYRITAELPGLIHAGRRRDQALQRFDRNELPPRVDVDAISASFSNGVLTVTLPKSAEAKQQERKIKVTAA